MHDAASLPDHRQPGHDGAKRTRGRSAMLVPLAIFGVIALVFLYALKTGDPSKLPSALIGKKVPEFSLPPVEGLKENGKPVPGFSSADLAKGKVSIVNVWASWCVACRQEHAFLVKLAKVSGAPLYGLNYKDRAADARRFLGRYGSPFVAVGADRRGRVAIDWGVYGVPETFVVDGEGRIIHKHVGPISGDAVERVFMPIIEKARAKALTEKGRETPAGKPAGAGT